MSDQAWAEYVEQLGKWLGYITRDYPQYSTTQGLNGYFRSAAERIEEAGTQHQRYLNAKEAPESSRENIKLERQWWLHDIGVAFQAIQLFDHQLWRFGITPTRESGSKALGKTLDYLTALGLEHPSHAANSLAHEIPVTRGYRFRKIYGQLD